MLKDRLVVVLILLPVGVGFALVGGAVFAVGILLLVNLAAVEFSRLSSRPDMQIPAWLIGLGASLLVFLRWLSEFDHIGFALTALLLVAMIWFLVQYERGMSRAATAFGLTIGGMVYLGWLISYFISLRELADGFAWTMIVIVMVTISNSLAFIVGKALGRHPMAPRLSPHKTWEGYAGGVAGGMLGGLAATWLFGLAGGSNFPINPLGGLIIGLVIGLVAPVGDLVVSLLKREAGRKDTGDLLPGHGGALDRIDAWLVAIPVGYYLILAVYPALLH